MLQCSRCSAMSSNTTMKPQLRCSPVMVTSSPVGGSSLSRIAPLPVDGTTSTLAANTETGVCVCRETKSTEREKRTMSEGSEQVWTTEVHRHHVQTVM
jgi:hypothetical protein